MITNFKNEIPFRWFLKLLLFAIFEAWRVRSAILNCFYDCFSFFGVTQQYLHCDKQMNKNWCNRISTKALIKCEKYITVRYSLDSYDKKTVNWETNKIEIFYLVMHLDFSQTKEFQLSHLIIGVFCLCKHPSTTQLVVALYNIIIQ